MAGKTAVEEKPPNTLVGNISHYINKACTIKNSKGTFNLSKTRIDDFKILKKFIMQFQGNEHILIIDIKLSFSNEFKYWMTLTNKYTLGYTGRMLSVIKAVCNET